MPTPSEADQGEPRQALTVPGEDGATLALEAFQKDRGLALAAWAFALSLPMLLAADC